MKIIPFRLLLLILFFKLIIGEPSYAILDEKSFQIIPGIRVGAIVKGSSESDLINLYQKVSVVSRSIDIGEGKTEIGTVLFPDDPERKLEILWKNSEVKKEPKKIIISGNKSRWKAFDAISLGTSLKELEKINAKSFTLKGFGRNQSGAIVSWNGGKLDSSRNLGLLFRLSPKTVGSPDYAKVLGDKEFSSSNESMQKLNPTIHEIVVEFK